MWLCSKINKTQPKQYFLNNILSQHFFISILMTSTLNVLQNTRNSNIKKNFFYVECWHSKTKKETNKKLLLGARTFRGNSAFLARDHTKFSYALKYFNQRPEDKRNF